MRAGPNTDGGALVVLSNLGPDERPRTGPNSTGSFLTECSGRQRVQISFHELGLPAADSYRSSVVWDGRTQHKPATWLGVEAGLSAELGPWESVMYTLTKQ